ncbi:MAG TPA: hypothetical protein VG457_03750, partial [Planctomycetota bacterium]|nr:hypothetical protein [Planctomycetota bacterium]
DRWLDGGQRFEERRRLGPVRGVLRVLRRPVVLRRTVRPRSVVMLGAVMPVMTLATLLVHYQP